MSSQSSLLSVAFFDPSGYRITLTTSDHTHPVPFGQHHNQTRPVSFFALPSFGSYSDLAHGAMAARSDASPSHSFIEANAIRAGPTTTTV